MGRSVKKWIEPLYTSQNHVFLSADDCYALRCSFLHEGVSNIEEQRARQVLNDFQFITPPPGMCIHNNIVNNTLQLQVDIFCNEIADAVDNWAIETSENTDIIERIEGLIVIHDSSNGVRF